MSQTREIDIVRIKAGTEEHVKDVVVREHPLTVMVNGEIVVTLLCTPHHLEALAAGFLQSEGLIENGDLIKEITLSANDNFANVILKGDFNIPEGFFQKRMVGSGCGRGSNFYDPQDKIDCIPVESDFTITENEIHELMNEFQHKSQVFRETGGVHSSALCSNSRIIEFSEDIGRHNAVDRIFGECMMKKTPLAETLVLTSGRISSEILIKAAKRGIPIIVSRSAPTDLSVGFADKMNVTLVGFVRGQRMNVYTHTRRIRCEG